MNDLFDRCSQFYKLARKTDDLAILQSNIGKYIHFSNSDRFGISYHKNIHPGNPRGAYGFPLTSGRLSLLFNTANKGSVFSAGYETAFEGYGWEKYIYIFDVKGNILNMDNINLKDIGKKIREFARSKYGGNYSLNYDPTSVPYKQDGHMFMQWLNQIFDDYKRMGVFKNEHSAINILIRGIGYDALETKNYGFGDDIRAEICVLNPAAIQLIAKVINPVLNKEQLKEVEYFNSDAYREEQRLKEKKYEEDMLAREEEIKRLREKLDIQYGIGKIKENA